jgi:tetratricopeptide (TPR) repeat protein
MRNDLNKPLEIIPAAKGKERAASQLVGPHSDRKKHITEHILNFINGKISFAQFAKLSRKRLQRVSEMAYIKLQHGRVDEAHRIFQALLIIDANNPYHHLALGSVFQKKKKDTEAVYHYTQCIEKNPKEMNAYVNRGEVYLRHRNYRKAAQDFRQAILLDPEGRNKFANRARQLVIAIKENLRREKVAKAR